MVAVARPRITRLAKPPGRSRRPFLPLEATRTTRSRLDHHHCSMIAASCLTVAVVHCSWLRARDVRLVLLSSCAFLVCDRRRVYVALMHARRRGAPPRCVGSPSRWREAISVVPLRPRLPRARRQACGPGHRGALSLPWRSTTRFRQSTPRDHGAQTTSILGEPISVQQPNEPGRWATRASCCSSCT
jgi:hypothetical protein